MGEQVGYCGGFIDHYLLPILYPESLTRLGQITLGIIALTVNLLVYWRVLRLGCGERATRKRKS